jgi:hypothetical protein
LMEVIQAKASSQNKEVSTDDDGPVVGTSRLSFRNHSASSHVLHS